MTRDEIINNLREVLIDCEIDQEILLGTKLIGGDENSLDMDSLGMVKFIVKVEEKFDIIVDFDVTFQNVEDVVEYVEKELSSAND